MEQRQIVKAKTNNAGDADVKHIFVTLTYDGHVIQQNVTFKFRKKVPMRRCHIWVGNRFQLNSWNILKFFFVCYHFLVLTWYVLEVKLFQDVLGRITVPANNLILAGTVSANNLLLARNPQEPF